jgi:serine/threonine protein kinase
MLGRLEVVEGSDAGRSFDLVPGQTLVIGRGRSTATRLTDPRVSRVHCVLEVADGRLRLTDSGSVSGTIVNGRPVSVHDLRPGDMIRIGETALRLAIVDVHDRATVGVALGVPNRPPVVDPSPPTPRVILPPAPPNVNLPPPEPRPVLAGGAPNLSGHTVSHYAIGSPLARGRSGTVYKARDLRDGKSVAFKVLDPEYTATRDKFRRFARAVETVVGLRHENLVSVYAGAGRANNVCWIAMEYVDGDSLTKVIQRAGIASMLDWRYALTIAVQVARALDAAHQHKVIHRNITPSNILIRKADNIAKLNDLILAKAIEGAINDKLSASGELLSDLDFTPPERTWRDATVDARSDIYSLGATVYALVTTHPPFEGTSLADTVAKIRTAEPVKPRKYQLAIPDPFQEIVVMMLAKRPEDRPRSAAELVRALERIAQYQGMTV